MERRENYTMESVIAHALSKLKPTQERECVRIMISAQIPVQIISRVVFSEHAVRTSNRRHDESMKEVIDQARAILHLANATNAVDFMIAREVPFHLIQRTLCDLRHRAP